ncbi:alpha/beta fold hydrolase [Streptomyces fuscigenes]|uniref:alpha/beta fold hydrolase n=1 Tax=Streptomyces fuscigenes TaxID=1528880 RepID=UPI001F411968|nr:alpha/beta fold hydrolase [Streptomyces fuscigenes]MCF3962105.1 alpha/beta hydrolase [Streptomyces fuscigenes]
MARHRGHARVLATERGDFAAIEALPAGDPRATVLMLPGFTGSKEDFNDLLDPLATAGYRVLAVDGRGQYESAPPASPEGYAQAELAADVLAQADAAGAPVHLLGHSFGGHVGRAAVLRDARPFRTFTVMSSGPAEISQPERERAKLLLDALAVMSMEQVWEAMSGMGPLEETPVGGADLHRRWMATDPGQLVAAAGLLVAEPDRVDELAAVDPPLPVHVVSGDEDGVWPPSLLDVMARRLGARRTVVADAGHSPNTERPAETAAALVSFWRQHP